MLTELGKLLVKLPVDARLGKLILLGQCFGALDECLTIAAGLLLTYADVCSRIC
jgi:ATP-dependent RNA helicase DHX29